MTLLQRHPDALVTATLRDRAAPDQRAPGMGAALRPTAAGAAALPDAPYRRLVGSEASAPGSSSPSRATTTWAATRAGPGRLLDVRDYCKLHIIAHYPARAPRRAGRARHRSTCVPVGKVGIDEIGPAPPRGDGAGGHGRALRGRGCPAARRCCSVCFQYPDGSGGNVTTVDSAAALVSERDVDLAERWLSADSIALAAPEVPLAVRRHLLRRATEKGALRVASLTTAEIDEARETGLPVARRPPVAERGRGRGARRRALARGGARALPEALRRAPLPALRPRSASSSPRARGAPSPSTGPRWTHAPALPVAVVSTAGAGDALLGGLLAGLAVGLPFAPAGVAHEPRGTAALDRARARGSRRGLQGDLPAHHPARPLARHPRRLRA